MRMGICLALGVTAVGLAACGGGGGGGGGAATCSPGPTAALSITPTGISPTNVCVSPNGQVTFSNTDTVAHHDIEFDTAGCPTVGDIAPGAQKTVAFPSVSNCSFHDGANAASAAFKGTVAVTTIVVSGGGY